MTKESAARKSPLKAEALPAPGHSVENRLLDLLFGKVLFWGLAALCTLFLAGYEWLRWWRKAPPSPLVPSVFVVVFVALAVWRICKIWPEIRHLRLGLRGERVVGQALERLRADGYEVFHDIPGEGFNVDHVLVGPGGVFAVETKTRMKPAKGQSEVVYDGESITVDGFAPERDPVIQVKAAARFVHQIIQRTTKQDVYVRPVVLFPGWYTQQPEGSDIWVLNDTAFPKWIQGANRTLDDAAVAQIASGIEMHVRVVSRA